MRIHIIAAISKNFGIGKNGGIPWHIPDDLRHFQNVTENSVVVMGRKTWLSIPEKRRPLKNRLNIVVCSSASLYKSDENVMFVNVHELDTLLEWYEDVYIIGGASLYAKYMGVAKTLHLTLVEKEFDCDVFFPVEKLGEYEIDSYSDLKKTDDNIPYTFVTYSKRETPHGETQYLNLLKNIMENGRERPDRTGVGTKSLFAPPSLRFDVSKTIPLYTTKFVGWKSVLKELLWILKGQTDSKVLEAQGVNIWKLNSTKEFLEKRNLPYREGDIGPMYGYVLAHYGHTYEGCDADYTGKGYNQIEEVLRSLKEDPYSRRHMMTTFDPSVVCESVLASCHGIVIQFYVDQGCEGEKHLSCHVYIRSNDEILGNPYNAASYGMMTHIFAKKVGMKPKELVISFGDAHIYKNHFEQAVLQMKRDPLPFPAFEVSDAIAEKSIHEIEVSDFNVRCYLHHPKINADMAV